EVLTDIRDQGSLSHYYRFVAGRIGVDIDEVESAVRTARRAPKQNRQGAPARQGAEPARAESYRQEQRPGAAPAGAGGSARLEYVYDERPDVSTLSAPISPARLKTEKGALMVALQHPEMVNAKLFDSLSAKAFEHPGYRRIQEAI